MTDKFTLPPVTDHLGENVEDARFCNFFDDAGNGPDHVYMTDEVVNNVHHDKVMREVAPNTHRRTFMLSFDRNPEDDVHATKFKAGGYTLSEEGARWLVGRLTAWLDAPRLAAPPVLVESADGAIAATPIADPLRFHVALLRDVPDGARVAPFSDALDAAGAERRLNSGNKTTNHYMWIVLDAASRRDVAGTRGDRMPCIVDTRPEVTP